MNPQISSNCSWLAGQVAHLVGLAALANLSRAYAQTHDCVAVNARYALNLTGCQSLPPTRR